jgi:hypothetical protein
MATTSPNLCLGGRIKTLNLVLVLGIRDFNLIDGLCGDPTVTTFGGTQVDGNERNLYQQILERNLGVIEYVELLYFISHQPNDGFL